MAESREEEQQQEERAASREALLAQDERIEMIATQGGEAKLLLLHDADVRRALVNFGGQAFHYTPNRAGATLLLVVSGVLLAAAVAIVALTGAAILPWRVAVVACVVSSLGLGSYVWRWRKLAQTSFVALDATHLYVGDSKRAWRIAWELLDARALGFESFDAERLSGKLTMQVSGQEIPLYLYHPLMHLKDLQQFMVEILTRLQQDAPEQLVEDEALSEEPAQ